MSSGTAETGQATIGSFNESSGSKNTVLSFGTRQHSDASIIRRMRSTSCGYVGIGTTSPDELLHLKSSATLEPVLKIENSNTDNKNPQIQLIKSTTKIHLMMIM